MVANGKICIVLDDSDYILKSIEKKIFPLFSEILKCRNGFEGIEVVKRIMSDGRIESLDMVICDVVMPYLDGIQFIKILRNIIKTEVEIPIIAITGIEEEKEIEVLNAGANDFVQKPSDNKSMEIFLEVLKIRVKNLLKVKIQQKEILKLNKELKEKSIRDPLTGIFNRGFVMETLENEIQRSERYGGSFSVVLIDLDNFKEINDSFGHTVGDEYLKKVARIIEIGSRGSDVPGRFGGDEFLIILPETDINGAKTFGAKILEKLLDEEISASIGVTQFKKGDSVEEIIKRVDNALYKGKKSGKKQVVTI